ncbi:putative DNA repair and recombination protein [Cladorrhinum sp. PSN332]|nr:putative DNA repair and recombination protein [Cladorrhinum sp. PSN332]
MRKLNKSLYAAAKGRPLDKHQTWGDAKVQLDVFNGSRRHAVSFVRTDPETLLTENNNNMNRNRHHIHQPTTFTALKARRESVTSAFFNQTVHPIFSFDVNSTTAAPKRMNSANLRGELGNIRRQFSTHPERMDDTPEQDGNGRTLLPEQLHVVNQAIAGRNIFFTGPAGCGKSTVLHEVRRRLTEMGKTVHVMAPTGIVALAIDGTTTWSFAGWSPNSNRIPLEELNRMDEPTLNRLKQADVIIIDEISMIESNYFERLNFLLTEARSRDLAQQDQPFGGIQIIVTGDFCQLPPVKPFQHCVNCGRELRKPDIDTPIKQRLTTRVCVPCGLTFKEEGKYAFSSPAWKRCNFVSIYLKAIHRQRDPIFISLLQKCRLGIPFSENDIIALTAPKPGISPGEAVKLFPLRADVRRTNHMAFQKLEPPSITFECLDHFHGRKKHRFQYDKRLDDGTLECLDQHRFERELRLIKGMRILLLANLDLKRGLCNGSQGIIAGFEDFNRENIPTRRNGNLKGEHIEIREKLIRYFAWAHESELRQNGFGWPIVKFDNGLTRTIYPDCTVNEVGFQRPYSFACRAQIPLTAGYALTIHKAQGMTLDKVIVDVSKAFEEKQIYVALSRAKTLEGLQVVGLKRGSVGCDDGDGSEMVRGFLRETFGEEAVEYRLDGESGGIRKGAAMEGTYPK